MTRDVHVEARDPHKKLIIVMWKAMQAGKIFTVSRSIEGCATTLPLENIGFDYLSLSTEGFPRIKITYSTNGKSVCEEATTVDLMLFAKQAKKMAVPHLYTW